MERALKEGSFLAIRSPRGKFHEFYGSLPSAEKPIERASIESWRLRKSDDEHCDSESYELPTKKRDLMNGKPTKKKWKGVRPWSKEEKSAVMKFFHSSIKKKIVPGKVQCEECILNSEGALSERVWKDVKYYVKNYITKLSEITSKKPK
ncbi:hypothetical protein JTB14_033038 [Gonioctena quinquepunctata]|nr:hypothetical protein JTB14_033038 [Gonioctena quinquepunctata]